MKLPWTVDLIGDGCSYRIVTTLNGQEIDRTPAIADRELAERVMHAMADTMKTQLASIVTAALADVASNLRRPTAVVADDAFYIVDIRQTFTRLPYISLWGPDNRGYDYYLTRAGLYTVEMLEKDGPYYWRPRFGHRTAMDRFPVAASIVRRFAIEGSDHRGPVIPNTREIRDQLTALAFRPASVTLEIEKSIRAPTRRLATKSRGDRP